jgi:hypothetical protein
MDDKQKLINSRTKLIKRIHEVTDYVTHELNLLTDWLPLVVETEGQINQSPLLQTTRRQFNAVTIPYFVYHCMGPFKFYEEAWIVNLFSCEELITVVLPNLILITTLIKCFWLFIRHIHDCHLFLEAVFSIRNLRTYRTTQTQKKLTHKHPCLEWDSNPRSHCSSERRQFTP